MPWSAAGGSGDWRARWGGSARTWSTVPISPCRISRGGPACSPCTISRRGWTSAGIMPPHRVRRRTPVLFELGLATMVITPGEKVRRAAIERFRLRPERVVAVPEAAAHWFRPVETGAGDALLPLRGDAGAAQESRDAARSLARSAPPSRGGPGAGRAAPRRRSRNSPGARPAPGRAKWRMRNCRRCIRARWRLSTRRSTKASDCRCWKPCNAARRVIASRAVEEAAGDAAIYADTPRELASAMAELASRPELAAAHARSVPWRARANSPGNGPPA